MVINFTSALNIVTLVEILKIAIWERDMQGLSTAIPSGSLNYIKCYDNIPPEADPGVSSSSTFSLTSATKLVTSIAAMLLGDSTGDTDGPIRTRLCNTSIDYFRALRANSIGYRYRCNVLSAFSSYSTEISSRIFQNGRMPWLSKVSMLRMTSQSWWKSRIILVWGTCSSYTSKILGLKNEKIGEYCATLGDKKDTLPNNISWIKAQKWKEKRWRKSD